MKAIKRLLNESTLIQPDPKLDKIISKFLLARPDINDDQIHALADKIGMEHHDLEKQIYLMLRKWLVFAPGKHKNVPDEKFDANELKMGIDVEKEHTDCPLIAKEISKDHLAELPDYYTRLAKMEKEGEAAKES